jgi:hypothetical protein
MAKEVKVRWLLGIHLFAVLGEPLTFLSQKDLVFFTVHFTAAIRKVVGQTYPEIRVQPGKKPLAGLCGKYFFDEFVAMVTGSEPIAMAYKEAFSQQGASYGSAVKGNVELSGDVIKNPHVVVASKPMYGDTSVAHGGQFAEKAHIPAWNYTAVLEPEIEYITKNKELFGIVFNFLKEGDDLFFTLKARCVVGYTKMKIREKVVLLGHQVEAY